MPFGIVWPRPTVRASWVERQRASQCMPDFGRQHDGMGKPLVKRRSGIGKLPLEGVPRASHRPGQTFPSRCSHLIRLLGSRTVVNAAYLGTLPWLWASRLRAARQLSKTPRWVARALRACPHDVLQGLTHPGSDWAQMVRERLHTAASCSAVYILFSHSGWYVGKANLSRQACVGPQPGMLARCMAHLRAALACQMRDGALPRYALLKKSLWSLSC